MKFPDKDFDSISLKDANVDSLLIAEMFDRIKRDKLNIHSMILLKGGEMAIEANAEGFGKGIREEVFSISKSFTSIAVGICQDRGLLTIDHSVYPYFEDFVERIAPGYEKITIKHLLTMSVGHEKDLIKVLDLNDNPFDLFFNAPLAYPPGTRFVYNNIASFMLSVIVSSVTGMTVNDFLHEALYTHIGIDQPEWKSFAGFNFGAFGLKIDAYDMARFGLLMLNKGRWKDLIIVSRDYTEAATTFQIDTSHNNYPTDRFGYGYQFWMNSFSGFRCSGSAKQYIVVEPELNAVFSIQAYEERELLDLYRDYIRPAIIKGWSGDKDTIDNLINRFREDSKPILDNERKTRQDEITKKTEIMNSFINI